FQLAQRVYEYSKSIFKQANRASAVTKGTKLTVTAVKKRSTGSRYFVLSDGKYVTALQSYVTE
ncbi:glycosyl hydrolase family 25, partial [Levilactobacillus brevis]|nr:glycosyl hydrolase family 25 [Levilactobacillus brevis]